jgi:ribosome-binding ATPase YchF (GTP1/OBG family)
MVSNTDEFLLEQKNMQIQELKEKIRSKNTQIERFELEKEFDILDKSSDLVEDLIAKKEKNILDKYFKRIENLKDSLSEIESVTTDMEKFAKKLVEKESIKINVDIKDYKANLNRLFMEKLASIDVSKFFETSIEEVAIHKVNKEIKAYNQSLTGEKIIKIMFQSAIHRYNVKVGKLFAKSMCDMSLIQTQTFKDCLKKLNQYDDTERLRLNKEVSEMGLLE